MSDNNVIQFAQSGAFSDSLTEILRSGARALLTQAVEAEVADFLTKHADLKTATGQRRVVRHGHLPERAIMTGIGPVAVRQPRVRDREATEGERIRYSPSILPRYARRSKSLEVLIPILYLKGISTGDFEEALAALVGKDAPGLSASTVARLKEAWTEEHARWQKRDLSTKRYVYFWADGIHLEARLEEQAQCILVIIGATPEGRKELVGFTDGIRESSQSWRDLLLDVKRRGLTTGPQIAVADGALGFWKALGEVWPTAREQRCWVHKTANILNKLPKSLHTKARRALQEIWMAETKKDAVAALKAFDRNLPGQIRQSGRLPDQRSRCAAGVLRFPRRALEALTNDEPHRKHLCDRPASHRPIKRLPVEQDRARHGLQACRGRPEELAPHRRPQPVAKTDPGCEVRRRDRGHRYFCRASSRRLILQAVTKIRR